MKRSAFGHTKMKRLMRALDIPLCGAVGILECLWHLTCREAPLGNIGKLSNVEISLGIGYDGDPEQLVAALIQARWLDLSGEHRLVVHDWADHWTDPSRRGYSDGKRVRRWQRLKAAGGELSRAVRDFIFARDGHQCVICEARERLTIDHKQPISKGGTNAIDNLQTLCRPCNSRKKDKVAR